MDKLNRFITILLAFGNICIAIAALRDGLVAFFEEDDDESV